MWEQVRGLLKGAFWKTDHTRPIFVHGCWRTGSTYVWSKYRTNEAFRCYYEPLHEALLSTKSGDFEAAFSGQGFYESVGHPQQATHYFSEYPIQPAGGVAHFERGLSYQRYCLDEKDSDDALETYVAHLIECAAESGQRPLLQFNRGLLRSRWLSKQFNSLNVLILRRPWNVWRSFQTRANYYGTMLCCIIGQNQAHRFFAPLAKTFDVPCFIGNSMAEEEAFYGAWASDREDVQYSLFYYFYALTFLYNAGIVDAVLDLDAISESTNARVQTERSLCRLRIPLDLSDCNPKKYQPAVPGRAEEEQRMLTLLKDHLGSELTASASVVSRASVVLNRDLQAVLHHFQRRRALAA
jgi:hypothetical protein